MNLLQKNDNYKNLLQVKLQKAFQVTPIYKEMSEWDEDIGYHMGVYLCLGQSPHNLKHKDATHINTFNTFQDIHDMMATTNKIFIFLGEGSHKIKKKAEQISCRDAIVVLRNYT